MATRRTKKKKHKKKPLLKRLRDGIAARIRTLREGMAYAVRKLIFPLAAGFTLFSVWFFLSQPAIDKLNEPKETPSVVIKTENGQVVGGYGEVHGDMLTFDEFPQSLVDAVLATEDRNFFHHFGVDPFGVARATVANVKAGKTVQGGSTITQQVAKNVFLTPERTLVRKLREMFLALSLEARFSKKEIMAIYLNRVYLGAGNYGVDAASRRYFNKSARDLSLSESAILAGLLKAPSRFAPTADPERARKRAEQVLANMVDGEYLKQPQADKAKKELAQTITRTEKNNAASSLYFTDWIIDQLPEFIAGAQEDLVVVATIQPQRQRMAEEAIAKVLDGQEEKYRVYQAALVSMSPDGAVRAMIGGRSYAKSQFNRAVQAQRQPGSSFKVFVYLAGLEAGLTPDSMVIDQPITVGKWQPKNYTGEYLGEISLREAVANSVNTVAVQVSEMVGRNNVVGMAHRLGIRTELNPDPSIALGSNEVNLLELTTGYAHLASGGMKVEPYGIVRIENTRGRVLYSRDDVPQQPVLNPAVVGMMNDLLSGVITSGTGRGAAIGRPAAGKTGTTSDYRDAWFMGYTPDLVTGVWVGNDDNSATKKVTGGTLPAPIWREYMRAALEGVPAHNLPISSGGWGFFGAQDMTSPEGVTPLPWQQPNADGIAPADGAPAAPPRRTQQESGEFNLGPSFWNKLFEQ